MNVDERQKIYRLLSMYYPHAKQLKDQVALTAWGLVLERFTYEDVKQSVVEYATTHKYFPDVADITGRLSPLPRERKPFQNCSAQYDEIGQKIDARIAADGGYCRITHGHLDDPPAPGSGVVGIMLRSYCPSECQGCPRREMGNCLFYDRITEEQSHCPLLQEHGGEGEQGSILRKYWENYCPSCKTPCFWLDGMRDAKKEGIS